MHPIAQPRPQASPDFIAALCKEAATCFFAQGCDEDTLGGLGTRLPVAVVGTYMYVDPSYRGLAVVDALIGHTICIRIHSIPILRPPDYSQVHTSCVQVHSTGGVCAGSPQDRDPSLCTGVLSLLEYNLTVNVLFLLLILSTTALFQTSAKVFSI